MYVHCTYMYISNNIYVHVHTLISFSGCTNLIISIEQVNKESSTRLT